MILSPRAQVPILKQHVISCHTFFRLSALKSEPVNLLGVNILRDTKTTFLTPKGTMSTLSFYMGVSPPPSPWGKADMFITQQLVSPYKIKHYSTVVDKTLTPSPWTTLMDYPNGLPKWTTLKWTTPENTVSDEYYIKKLRFYTYTARTCIFLFRMAFSRHVE